MLVTPKGKPMVALTAIPITCWLCAWLARPGKPLIGNDIQEFVYGRLLGRQQRLTFLALIVTGMMLVALVVMLPQHIDTDLQSVRGAHTECVAQLGRDETDSGRDVTAPVHCYELHAGGVWVVAEYRRGSNGQAIATVTAPIALENTIHGSKP
jgi:hypothetical protein